MKRYFLIALFSLIWLFTTPLFSDEEPNPFREGTEKKTLTEGEKQSLLQYANTSKTTLERAKREAAGKPLQETLDIYVDAIIAVVLKSYDEEKRRELLMRVSLNQALQLTTGIPTPDGKAVEEKGVLTHAPVDLIAAILENAIDLSLSYYPKDKEAIEAGNLLKLPFFEYAACRLSQAKSWLTGIHSWQLQLEFEKAILEQWKSSVLSDQNLERERVAPLILDVEKALTQVTLPQYTVSQKVRFLRGTIRQILEDSVQMVHQRLEDGAQKMRNLKLSRLIEGISFVFIPAGTFEMGSVNGDDRERPLHSVTLTESFWMMTTEVTQKQWMEVMGSNPSQFKGEDHPVENITWHEAQLFISRLNKINDGWTYRLPTEAEWEYAARAGTKTAYSFDDDALLAEHGWYDKNSGGTTHPVASCPTKEKANANGIGLYDMHGNVWEWCSDWYGEEYPLGIITDPRGPSSGRYRVIRGGCWHDHAQSLRSANRNSGDPESYHSSHVGLRLVRTK